MSSLFKNLLGNGEKEREAIEEMRGILEGMRQERARFEALVGRARESVGQMEELGEPIAKAADDVAVVASQVEELQQRFSGLSEAAGRVELLDERAAALERRQEESHSEIAAAVEDAQQVRATYEGISSKIDQALELHGQLDAFLEVDRPFQELRGEAESLRGQIDGTGDHLARLREQHDRLLDAHKLAMAKMEALERRRDELGRELQDKERRVMGVEQAVRAVDGVQHTVAEIRREMGALKVLGDAVGQKTAALEAQREAVERALARADRLDEAMRQVDAGVRNQQENQRALTSLQEDVEALRGLHETVVERSREVATLQSEIDESMRASREELAAARDETTKTVERFDFESRGLESVSQRVADLRSALSECEGRLSGLAEMSCTVGELTTQTQALDEHLRTVTGEVEAIDHDLARLQTMRRELEHASQTAGELGAQVARLEQAQPAMTAALHDLAELGAAHAAVKDALERTQLARDEFTRLWESHSSARSWLAEVEQLLGEVKEKIGAVHELAPTVEYVRGQAERVEASQSALEARQAFVEDLHRKLAELGALAGRLDERDRQLAGRMDAAEERFVGLGAHAEEAERLGKTMAGVTKAVREAERRAGETGEAVTALEARCTATEALAERTQRLRQELDQRQHTLEQAAEDLERASTLRQEAAGAAQELGKLAHKLGDGLDAADRRLAEVSELAGHIEDRAATLRAVERRLDEFAERLGRWEMVDQDVARSLEQLAVRQNTVEALRGDLDRMAATAEKTVTDARAITSARREVEESRQLLEDLLCRHRELEESAGALDERQHQLARAEERLARADALLVDVRSSMEALQGQRAIVDQAVEKAGSLQFLVKQAEATIDTLREERKMTAGVRAAMADAGDDDEDDAELPRAA